MNETQTQELIAWLNQRIAQTRAQITNLKEEGDLNKILPFIAKEGAYLNVLKEVYKISKLR